MHENQKRVTRRGVIGASLKGATVAALGGLAMQSSAPATASTPQPVPDRSRFLANAVLFRDDLICLHQDPKVSVDAKLASTYYDLLYASLVLAEVVPQEAARFYELAWLASESYLSYCSRSSYLIPGYWAFTEGLKYGFFRRNCDERMRSAVYEILNNAAYHPGPVNSDLRSTLYSRETAYVLRNLINGVDLGLPWTSKIDALAELAIGHMRSWFVLRDAPYVRPFMVSLTMTSLIRWYERTGDDRVPQLAVIASDDLWANCALAQGGMAYTDRQTPEGGREPAPDLDVMVATTLYGWPYCLTGEQRFADRGDALWSNGVSRYDQWGTLISGAYLGRPGNYLTVQGKKYCQQFSFGLDYLKWRERPRYRAG